MKIRGNRWIRGLDRWLGIPLVAFLGLFKGKGKSPIGIIPKKILLLKLNALGDTLLLLTITKVLKEKWPGVQITYLGSNINKEILTRSSDLDRLIIFDLARMMWSPWYLFKFVIELRKEHYDVVIDGSQWERIAAILVGFTRGDYKVGFQTPGQHKHFVYHASVPHRRDRHEMYCFHDLLVPLGIQVPEDVKPLLLVRKEDRVKLKNLLGDQVPEEAQLMVIHPGCGEHGDFRQWSLANYRELGQRWLDTHEDGWIILTGVGGEIQMCETLKNGISERVISLAGMLDIGMTTVLLERVSVLVCGNTGIMHLASIHETPTVAIHGPTDPVKWGPINPNAIVVQSSLECVPCLYLGHEYGCDCPTCMDSVSVDAVWQAVMELEHSSILSKQV